MDEHGPPAPDDSVEYDADPASGMIIETHPSYAGDIELGSAYVFVFMAREMTGVAVRHRKGWVTLRTKSTSFSVPVEDVLRPAPK